MPAQVSAPEDPIRPERLSVLVVDDNADLCLLIRLILESDGFETHVASDGDDALAEQTKHPSGILITDIFMPGRDGLELIQRFSSIYPTVKIIAMSGGGERSTGDYLPVARSIGAHALLRKPFSTDELLVAVRVVATPTDPS